jgi:hypothetical protein
MAAKLRENRWLEPEPDQDGAREKMPLGAQFA